MQETQLSKTGVIQPLPGIGDMIWHLPALQALAAQVPDGKLTLFTKASSLADQLLAGEGWIGDIYYLPKARGIGAALSNFVQTWKSLRAAKLHKIYILHQSARYLWAARLAGIRDIVGYPEPLARSKDNGWIKSLALLDALKIPVASRHSCLHISALAKRRAIETFGAYPKPWFIVASGAADARRMWPTERFAQCVDAISQTFSGTVFLTGSKNEAARVDDVFQKCTTKEAVVVATGIDFQAFLGLLAECSGILGNDSGPINVAAALGKPAFVLCGNSKPAMHSPNLIPIQSANAELTNIIREDLAMDNIEAEQVVDVIRKHSAFGIRHSGMRTG